MRAAALIVLASLNFSAPSQAADERQIRRDCTYDALTYCKAAIAKADRGAVISCMLFNRDKLQKKCSRHLY